MQPDTATLPPDAAACLAATDYIDWQHPAVLAYVARVLGPGASEVSPRERAIRLFYAVRDDIRYDPYRLYLLPGQMTASQILERGYGYCVVKAILLAACCRAAGIPARLGFANVKNHLTTEKLSALLRTDVFAFHGYNELYLDGRWVKATPTFNLTLCEKFGVKPLEFDGQTDSLYHAYDNAGNRHMEYLEDLGTYADMPYDRMMTELRRYYPHYIGRMEELQGSFEDDGLAERTRA